MRPPSGKQAGVRRKRPGGRRSSSLESNSLIRETPEVGGRVAGIPIQTEVIGPDGIENDQQDIQGWPRRLGSMVTNATSSVRLPVDGNDD